MSPISSAPTTSSPTSQPPTTSEPTTSEPTPAPTGFPTASSSPTLAPSCTPDVPDFGDNNEGCPAIYTQFGYEICRYAPVAQNCATTCCYVTDAPTTSEPTTSEPTTMPTTSEPTLSPSHAPATSFPTTALPTSAAPTPVPSPNPTQAPSCSANLEPDPLCTEFADLGACWTYHPATNEHVRDTELNYLCASACCNAPRPSSAPSAAPSSAPSAAPSQAPTPVPTPAPVTPSPTTIRPTDAGETWMPTQAPTSAPTTSEPSTSGPSTAPSEQCPMDAAGFCLTADCSATGDRGAAIRYNCQRSCDSCRTQEIIDIDNALASGLSQDDAYFSITVTFNVDYTELSASARASLQTLLQRAFCGRITAAGVMCDAADLMLTLSAGSQRRARRTAGTTLATVILPSSTTQAQATAISNGIKATPITVSGSMAGGALISSMDTAVAFETSGGAAGPGAEATPDRAGKITTAVLAAVLAVAVLGIAYLLNARTTSYQMEKASAAQPNAVQELGWHHSAEVTHENMRATVWHQEGSADGSHYFPATSQTAPLEPAILDNSCTTASSPLKPAGPANFHPMSLHPMSSRLR